MDAGLRYRGRFAPSPTGPLHFGSLVAALASYLDARHAGGEWLLRIEDIDPPREVPGAADAIRHSLERHALLWDGEVVYQSQRTAAYEAALQALQASGRLFRCCCTRAILGPGGSCGRRGHPGPRDRHALRFEPGPGAPFDDLILGHRIPPAQPGDIVLRRRDGLHAYALAVVVDDAWQGVTHVLRGQDLLEQTPAQCTLHTLLGRTPPQYGHVPLLCTPDGDKLSKQTGATALDDTRPLDNLRLALRLLGQASATTPAADAADLLTQAARDWSRRPLVENAGAPLVYAPGSTP